MTTAELAKIYRDVIARIEFYWHFYAATVIVILGWHASAASHSRHAVRLARRDFAAFTLLSASALLTSSYFALMLLEFLLLLKPLIDQDPPDGGLYTGWPHCSKFKQMRIRMGIF